MLWLNDRTKTCISVMTSSQPLNHSKFICLFYCPDKNSTKAHSNNTFNRIKEIYLLHIHYLCFWAYKWSWGFLLVIFFTVRNVYIYQKFFDGKFTWILIILRWNFQPFEIYARVLRTGLRQVGRKNRNSNHWFWARMSWLQSNRIISIYFLRFSFGSLTGPF